MSGQVDRASQWMYRGIWRVLTDWFRVPEHPPSLPALPGEQIQSFRPAEAYLSYLKLQFWLSIVLFDFIVLAAWLVLTAARPRIGILLAPLAVAIVVVPAVVAYLAIHLRYDTTWYVLSGRSLRIRSGIWVINEATITFENIQNVTVESGPVERWFGIGNVIVDTAGGGKGGGHSENGKGKDLHRGVIAGVANAAQIRQLLLSRLSTSKSTGLGDEPDAAMRGWHPEHIAVLREIRDALRGW